MESWNGIVAARRSEATPCAVKCASLAAGRKRNGTRSSHIARLALRGAVHALHYREEMIIGGEKTVPACSYA
jgi:hypothetical protein